MDAKSPGGLEQVYRALAKHPMLVLVLFASLMALPGMTSLPPLDRDEARFAQATAQMLETGDFIAINFQDAERNKKPVGIHWLQSASVSLVSDVADREIWAYRIPSAIAAVAAILLLYWTGTALFSRQTAFLAALVFAASVNFAAEAAIAKTDATLLACVIAAQGALARVFLATQAGKRAALSHILIFWIAVAAGILIKGPVGPMITGFCIIALIAGVWRFNWIRALRPFLGVAICLVLVGPWLVAIGLATEGRFLLEAVGVDMLGKVADVQESHGAPPGYYLAMVWAGLWPANLFLLPGLALMWTRREHAGVLFCAAWALPAWLLFELSATKLPHYVLPLYPALALLGAEAARRIADGRGGVVLTSLLRLNIVVWIAAAGFLAALLDLAPAALSTAGASLTDYAATGLMLLGTALAALFAWRKQIYKTALLSAGLGAAFAWIVLEHTLPKLDDLMLTPRIAAALEDAGAHPRLNEGVEPAALVGYNEPSLVFLLGTETHHDSPAEAAAYLAGAPGRVAVVDGREAPALLAGLAERGAAVAELATLDGLNYSRWEEVRLHLYQSVLVESD